MPRLLVVALLAAACQEMAPVETTSSESTTPVLAAVGEEEAVPLPAWRFLEVKGDVRIDGAPAEVDGEIGNTSTIETGAGGSALITLGAKSIVEVRASSKLTLGSSERKKTSVALALGQLWSFFGAETEYEVVTNNTVAGVRGTVFYVNAEQEKETIVCACTNAVHMESLDPRKPTAEDFTAKEWEHIGVSFKRRGKRVKTKKLGPYPNPPNHPDARGKEILALMPE